MTWDWSARSASKEGMTRFVLLLPPGWCPIAANPLAQVQDQIAGQPGAQARLSARYCSSRTAWPLSLGSSATTPRNLPVGKSNATT